MSEVPKGWSYNPSSWKQRLPIMLLAFFGFLMARILPLFNWDMWLMYGIHFLV